MVSITGTPKLVCLKKNASMDGQNACDDLTPPRKQMKMMKSPFPSLKNDQRDLIPQLLGTCWDPGRLDSHSLDKRITCPWTAAGGAKPVESKTRLESKTGEVTADQMTQWIQNLDDWCLSVEKSTFQFGSRHSRA